MSPWNALRRWTTDGAAETTPNIASEWPTIYLVPAWIDEVGAVLEGARKSGRRPGVVDDDDGALRMRRGGDRRQVLHLEGERARRFEIDRLCVLAHQRGDAGADQRIVIGRRDAHAGEHGVADMRVGP